MSICVTKRHTDFGLWTWRGPACGSQRPGVLLWCVKSIGSACNLLWEALKNKVGNFVPALHSLSTADQWFTPLVTNFITLLGTLLWSYIWLERHPRNVLWFKWSSQDVLQWVNRSMRGVLSFDRAWRQSYPQSLGFPWALKTMTILLSYYHHYLKPYSSLLIWFFSIKIKALTMEVDCWTLNSKARTIKSKRG